MRVGIAVYDLSTLAGGANLALTLGRELRRERVEVAYACVYENLKLLEKKFGKVEDLSVYRTKRLFFGNKLIGYNSLISHTPAIHKMCKEFKPDVVIEAGGFITSLVIPMFRGIPTMHYCVSPFSEFQHEGIFKLTALPYNILERKFARKVTRICSISEYTKRLVKKFLGRDSTVIYPSVDIELFVPAEVKENIILCVLRYQSNYKLEDMIDRFYRLETDFFLYLVGGLAEKDSWYYKFLERKTKSHKKVKLFANVDFKTLLELYSKAKLFWYPIGAYFGIAVAEAQSAGLPVIALDPHCTGPSEILIEGETGYVVDNFDEFVNKTQTLIEDSTKLHEMSKNARRNAIERFDLKIFRKKFIALTREIC